MLRATSALLSAVALALAVPAPASGPEIPAHLLDQEARTRAAFTPSERARVQALEARLSPGLSVADVNAMTQGENMTDMFVVMMAYLKMVQKEAREDRKLGRTSKEAELSMKSAKLDLEKQKIESMKAEAGDRYQQALARANSLAASLKASSRLLRIATPTSPPSGPVPIPYPNTAFKSPRDPASGQATGKRQHMPIRARTYYDQTFPLQGGRVFLVNTKTGEVEFGDGTKGDIPPTGETPADGTYTKEDGSPLIVRGGRVVSPGPTPTKTPVKGLGAVGNVPK